MNQPIALVDTHCHLDLIADEMPELTVEQLVQRAKMNNVHHIVNVCVRIADFPQLLKTAEQYPNVSASVGLHPNEQDEEVTLETLLKLSAHPKIIAIGETGLDYYRSEGDHSWQRARFITHIEAARACHKPLIVHTRAAKDDTIDILKSNQAMDVGGIMHCFTEDLITAKKALDLGFYISFSGIVTFKNATQVAQVAKAVPLDRLLIETDAPYLAPMPYRSKINEPAYLHHTAAFIAELRGIPLDDFAMQTTQNFYRLFPGASHV